MTTAAINHTSRAHAVLSASAADRWMHCPPSARLAERYPQTSSSYAEEGTRAHEIAEQCLRAFKDGMPEPVYHGDDLRVRAELQPYIDWIVETYNEYKDKSPDTLMLLETRVDFSSVVPDGFGTGDVIIISGSTLHIIDLKFGKGVPVEAALNPQLMLYALGALNLFEDLYDINLVRMTINQPRLDHISTSFASAAEIRYWGDHKVAPVAKQAYEGKGEFACGDWCRWCPVKNCKHRASVNQKLIEDHPDPAVLNKKDLSAILQQLDQVKAWMETLKTYATDQILQGSEIDVYKRQRFPCAAFCDEQAVVNKSMTAHRRVSIFFIIFSSSEMNLTNKNRVLLHTRLIHRFLCNSASSLNEGVLRVFPAAP